MAKKTDYQTVLDRLGLSQMDAGRILNVDARTSRRWALGEVKPPPVVMTLLRIIDVSPVNLKRAMKMAEEQKVRPRRDGAKERARLARNAKRRAREAAKKAAAKAEGAAAAA